MTPSVEPLSPTTNDAASTTGSMSVAATAVASAAASALLTWTAPLFGVFLALGSVVISVALLVRGQRRQHAYRWTLVCALMIASATLLYVAVVILFMLSFHDPVIVPTLAPGEPD